MGRERLGERLRGVDGGKCGSRHEGGKGEAFEPPMRTFELSQPFEKFCTAHAKPRRAGFLGLAANNREGVYHTKLRLAGRPI